MRKTAGFNISGLSGYSNDVDELKRILEKVPTGAKFDISKTEGDRFWESDTYTIDINWSEEV